MLIAVVIMAVVGTTLATTIGSVAGQTFALERRTVANWVALNEMAKLRINLRANPRALPEGKSNARIFMSDREWEVRTTVLATEHPLLRRVEIDVFELLSGDTKGPYDHLVAFIGRH